MERSFFTSFSIDKYFIGWNTKDFIYIVFTSSTSYKKIWIWVKRVVQHILWWFSLQKPSGSSECFSLLHTDMFCLELDHILPMNGPGHVEKKMLECVTKVLWDIIGLSEFASWCDFSTVKSQQFLQSFGDHHITLCVRMTSRAAAEESPPTEPELFRLAQQPLTTWGRELLAGHALTSSGRMPFSSLAWTATLSPTYWEDRPWPNRL